MKENDKIVFNQTSNVMYPGQYYLVFSNESEINSKTKGNDFYFIPSIFSCVKLTNREMQKPCDIDFNACSGTVQFCNSTTVLSAFERLEVDLINKYDVYEYTKESN